MGAAAVLVPASPAPFAQGRERFEQLVQYLGSEKTRTMKHSDLERELEKQGRELMRQLLQDHLDLRCPGQAEGPTPVRDADGLERTESRTHERKLETVFGTVSVQRQGYGADGAQSLHPLDAELNLPRERYSHELRRRAAEEASKNSFDETVESLGRHTGAHIGKRQVEELAVRAAQDFAAFYERRRETSEAEPDRGRGSVLVVTCDGKGVVMRPEGLREATRKAAEQSRHKLETRLSKGEKRNRKRMATVASVYTIQPHVRTPEQVACGLAPVHEAPKPRPRPENKRVWASLEQEPEQVIEEAFREAAHRDPSHERIWAALVDGNKTQIRLLKKFAAQYEVKLTIVVDVIHVLEYVWKAGLALHQEGTAALETWVHERLLRILRGGCSHVAAGMRRSATRRKLTAKQREPIDKCAGYLLNYKNYLAYHDYLAAGLPIATGVIEGACRHLISDRMDRTGARWGLQGAEAVLRLRALRSSHDFDEYWAFHEEQEYRRNHASRYADGQVPPTKNSGRRSEDKPRLTRIK